MITCKETNEEGDEYYCSEGPSTSYSDLCCDPSPCSALRTAEPVDVNNYHSWVAVEDNGSSSSSLVFICMWRDCHTTLAGEAEFRSHFDSHSSSFFIEEESGRFICPVVGCSFSTSTTTLITGHTSMHLHHALQQMEGLSYIHKCDKTDLTAINRCGFAPVLQADYDGLTIHCRWGFCAEEFYDANIFFDHILRHIEYSCRTEFYDPRYHCVWNGCKKGFKDKGDFKKHVSAHVALKRCACPFCGTYMSSFDRLAEHLKRRLPEMVKTQKCMLCGTAFADDSMLAKHMYNHLHSAQCGFCGVVFRTPYELERHIGKTHHEGREREFMCEEEGCGKGFLCQVDLDQHMRVHKVPSLRCKDCGDMFRFYSQLSRHREEKHIEHKVVGSKYLCHICNILFPRGDKLTIHLKKQHVFPVPDGFSRYTYKLCADGYYRLQTKKLLRSNLLSS